MKDLTRQLEQAGKDYERVEEAIRFLERRFREQPPLAEVANAAGLSEYHFHRLFTRWAGTTPKRFLQFLTADYAKERLRDSVSVLDAAYDAGLSGGGRLHDLMVSLEAFSPGEYRNQGQGVPISFGVHPSPFGDCLLATTSRGICALEFLADREVEAAGGELADRWPGATIQYRAEETAPVLERLFRGGNGGQPERLTLHLKGTNFQIKVWQALLRIPSGAVVTYGDVARFLGRPGAARAVGGAVGKNPVSFLIPCHRVIRSVADFGNYRWGTARKKAILGWEAAHAAALTAQAS